MEKFKAETLPQWEKDLLTASGNKIPIEIEWATMAGDPEVAETCTWASALRCPVDAMVSTCSDAVGKKRLVAGIRKLVLRHDRAIKDEPDKPAHGLRLELKDGTLTVIDNWALNHLMSSYVQPEIEKLL